jgi:hypothetical protein
MLFMCAKKYKYVTIITLFLFCGVLAGGTALAGKKTDDPAELKITVQPDAAAPGSAIQVKVELTPKSGFKLNRYPKISLKVPAVDGMVAAAEVTVGNDDPPPLDKQDKNYFKVVDPLILDLELDESMSSGDHTILGKLKYFYCVAASGYCSMMRTEVLIPVTVK